MSDLRSVTDAHFGEAVDFLGTLVHLPTIARDPNSPIEDCVQLLHNEFIHLGARVEVLRLPGARPLLFVEIAGRSSRSLMFYQHYDVQPAGPLERWDSNPFEMTERDGVLYGRGIADNKGNLAARIAALRVLRDVHGELPLTVRFLIEGEEEIGSPYLPKYLQAYDALFRADACIWEGGYRDADERFVVTLGSKGMCRVILRAHGPVRDLHGKFAPLTFNPAVRLAAAINCLVEADGRVRVLDFYDAVVAPDERELAWITAAAPDLEHLRQETGLGEKIPAHTGQEALERLVFLSTGNVEGFVAGAVGEEARSIVPAEAVANLCFRLVPNQQPEAIYQQVRAYLDAQGFADIEAEFSEGVLPARTRSDDPIVQATLSAVAAASGETPLVWPMSPGTGPMATVCHSRGIPALALGVGNAGSSTHAPNENIRLNDYRLGIEVIARLIETFAEADDAG
ncbi:MAG TPA: M20/M25/M40 family metallo-hydrolase [Phototrophicaceae bacterium]|nr:M20/M25/M40 family metallo-hydrolase [Phototrophicaceae bacterium]